MAGIPTQDRAKALGYYKLTPSMIFLFKRMRFLRKHSWSPKNNLLIVFSDLKESCQKRRLNLHVSIVLKYSLILEACVSISKRIQATRATFVPTAPNHLPQKVPIRNIWEFIPGKNRTAVPNAPRHSLLQIKWKYIWGDILEKNPTVVRSAVKNLANQAIFALTW